MKILHLVCLICFGFGLSHLLGLEGLQDAGWYTFVVASLLSVGLYVSTYGIVLKEAKQHLKIILSAVTIGVVLKALIVGGSLALIFQDPFFLVLGVTVAQIDPLSVAGLMKGNRMSHKAKTILAAWASFDDPVTVLMALYVPLLVAQLTGADMGAAAGLVGASTNLAGYVRGLGLNVLLAGGVLVLWLGARYYAKKTSVWLSLAAAGTAYVLLAVAFSASVLYFLMLGLALVGLFLRPPKVAHVMEYAIIWALRIAAVLLGFLLVDGINIGAGAALGIAAYGGQVIVGFLLTRGLPPRDRWHIAFAQQNGITAIILALLFEPLHPGTVAIVAPAIVMVNGLHEVANKVLDGYLEKRTLRRA